MEALLADEPLPVLEGVGLAAVSLALLLASVARGRSRQSVNRVARVYWGDVSRAGYIWAAATVVVLVGGLLEIEGLRIPIWLFLAVVLGLAGLAIVRLRWTREAIASRRLPVDDPSRPGRARLVSTAWEVGTLGAGLGGLLVYAVSVSHDWGHPVHWLVAGVGVAVGYALGLIVATPRYTVERLSP